MSETMPVKKVRGFRPKPAASATPAVPATPPPVDAPPVETAVAPAIDPIVIDPVAKKLIEAAESPAVESDIIPAAVEMPAPQIEEVTEMATITNNVTGEAADKVQAVFGDLSGRFKAALEKSQKLGEEMVELTKGNVEAVVASTKIAAKGGEAIGQEVGEYGRKTLESTVAAFKGMAGVKSPTELFQLQSDYLKSSFDAAVAEASKLSEAMLKIAGEAAQPLSSRYALAAEKIKAATL